MPPAPSCRTWHQHWLQHWFQIQSQLRHGGAVTPQVVTASSVIGPALELMKCKNCDRPFARLTPQLLDFRSVRSLVIGPSEDPGLAAGHAWVARPCLRGVAPGDGLWLIGSAAAKTGHRAELCASHSFGSERSRSLVKKRIPSKGAGSGCQLSRCSTHGVRLCSSRSTGSLGTIVEEA